jgi:hypothetical protein
VIGNHHYAVVAWSKQESGGAMKIYDPLKPPKPEEWQSMDEQQRLDLVESFHRRARIRLPDAKVHAVIHAVVENQVALGDDFVFSFVTPDDELNGMISI